MTIAGDLTLIATDPATGKFRLSASNPGAVYAGAHLIDLLEAGRLSTRGEGRRLRVLVDDRAPTGRPDLDHALSRLTKDKPLAVASVISRLGHEGRKRAYLALEEEHRVRSRTDRVLLFDVTRYDVLDTDGRDELIRTVRMVLLDGAAPDGRTGPLVALLAAVNQLGLVVDRRDRKAAKARAKAISAEDWASEAVRQAVAGAETAVMAAIMAAAVASAAGGSS